LHPAKEATAPSAQIDGRVHTFDFVPIRRPDRSRILQTGIRHEALLVDLVQQ
jgi:hypothetical protein